MIRWLRALAILSATTAFATDELPAPDDEQPLEIEPPLLLQNLTPATPPADSETNDTAGDAIDIARVETDLARAKKSSASGDRLYKAGILAKVEAEERALKVVRLEAKLAEAQLQAAKAHLEELKSANIEDEAFTRELRAAEALVDEATQNATRTAEAKRVAEVDAAARNVERQQKLLSLGSGRKSDVNRAEEKLAELQQARN